LKFRLGSANKAKVAIANRIARVVYKILLGNKYKEIGYARAMDDKREIERLISRLQILGVEIRRETNEKIVAVKKATVTTSGISKE